jgi:hypothetical protein
MLAQEIEVMAVPLTTVVVLVTDQPEPLLA